MMFNLLLIFSVDLLQYRRHVNTNFKFQQNISFFCIPHHTEFVRSSTTFLVIKNGALNKSRLFRSVKYHPAPVPCLTNSKHRGDWHYIMQGKAILLSTCHFFQIR